MIPCTGTRAAVVICAIFLTFLPGVSPPRVDLRHQPIRGQRGGQNLLHVVWILSEDLDLSNEWFHLSEDSTGVDMNRSENKSMSIGGHLERSKFSRRTLDITYEWFTNRRTAWGPNLVGDTSIDLTLSCRRTSYPQDSTGTNVYRRAPQSVQFQDIIWVISLCILVTTGQYESQCLSQDTSIYLGSSLSQDIIWPWMGGFTSLRTLWKPIPIRGHLAGSV